METTWNAVLRLLLPVFVILLRFDTASAIHPINKQWDDSNPDGVAGVDYPIYANVPRGLPFKCNQVSPGFYADPETQCQVWHLCDLFGRRHSFLCPNRTMFNQLIRGCDWWYNVDCDASADLYYNNEDVFQTNQLDRLPNRIAHTIAPPRTPWTTPRPFVPFIPQVADGSSKENDNGNSIVSQPPPKPPTFQVVRVPVTTAAPPPPPPPPERPAPPPPPPIAFTPPRPPFSRIRPKPTNPPRIREPQSEFESTSSPEGPPTAWTVRFIAGNVASQAPPRGIRPIPLDQQWRIAHDQERAFPDLSPVTEPSNNGFFPSTPRTPHTFESSSLPEQEFPFSSVWTTSRPWHPSSTPVQKQPEEQQQTPQPPRPQQTRRPPLNRFPPIRSQTQPPPTQPPATFPLEDFDTSARTPFIPFGARTPSSTWAPPLQDVENNWQDTTTDDRNNNFNLGNNGNNNFNGQNNNNNNNFNGQDNNNNNNFNRQNNNNFNTQNNNNDNGREQWSIGALDIQREQTFEPEVFTESFVEESTEQPFAEFTPTEEPFFWSDTPFSPEVPFGARTTQSDSLSSVEQEVEFDSQTVATPASKRRPSSNNGGWWSSAATEAPTAFPETVQPFTEQRNSLRVSSPKSGWWTPTTAQPFFEPSFNRTTTVWDAPAVVKHSVSFSPSTSSSATARFTSRFKSSRAPHRVSTHSAAWWTETSSEANFEVNSLGDGASLPPEVPFQDTAQTDNFEPEVTTEFQRLRPQSTQNSNEITTYHPRRHRLTTTTVPPITEAVTTLSTDPATDRVPRVRTSRRRKVKSTSPSFPESTENPTTTSTFVPTPEPEPSIPLVFGARLKPRKFFADNSVADSVLQPFAVQPLSSSGTAYDLPVVLDLKKDNIKHDTREAAI